MPFERDEVRALLSVDDDGGGAAADADDDDEKLKKKKEKREEDVPRIMLAVGVAAGSAVCLAGG